MFRGKGPHRPELAHDTAHIQSLMLYTELIEYKFVGDTKTPFLRWFPFISTLKAGEIINTKQRTNYPTVSPYISGRCSKTLSLYSRSLERHEQYKNTFYPYFYHSFCFDN